MVIVFDGDIFEEKVSGYEELIASIEETDIAAVTNPGFELFLILHISGSFEQCIRNREADFLKRDDAGKYSYAATVFRKLTGMNAKKNPAVGELAANIHVAIAQEKRINQDIHRIRGIVSSNIGKIIEGIIAERPDLD